MVKQPFGQGFFIFMAKKVVHSIQNTVDKVYKGVSYLLSYKIKAQQST